MRTEIISGDTHIVLSQPPVYCAVKLNRPLPPLAYEHLTRLAETIEDVANALSKAVDS